ncbi:similar to Saccharomyces cerevisiae YPL125W KAP120 Karyopherin responsible for the nuclear import of ribosome maturation factor Rfp1p [Geotrichum candidum]|nr:similar to Saccharomyces cerevisiae YPL125W KAP120 Karyopherin responsible for the nuclear import of ribosome maturation factor Rfp1p [Geotrichum candidum]
MSTIQITFDAVYQAVEAASSQDNADQNKLGEEQLKALEILPGFHSFLQNVCLNTSFPLPVRCFAALYLRNVIRSYWDEMAVNGINNDEKAQIRLHLCEMVKEPNKSLSTEYALIIAEIADFDFPHEWPSLFNDVSDLVALVQATGNITELNNLLRTVSQIVKQFPTLWFGTGRTGSQAASSNLVKAMGQIYLQSTQKWIQSIDLASMEIGYKALEVTGDLLIKCHPNYNRSEEVKLFFKLSVEYFHRLLHIYDKQPTEPVAEHICMLGNTYRKLCQWQLVPFLMIPDGLQLIQTYLSIVQSKARVLQQVGSAGENRDIVEFWEKIVVQGLEILSKVFELRSTHVMSNNLDNIKQDSEVKQAVGLLEKSLFAPETIKSLLDLLVTSYLKLTPRDLENLQYDHEEWVNREMSYLLPNNVQGYAERIVSQLYFGTSDPLGPPPLTFMEKAWQSDDLLIHDVAYNLFVRTGGMYFQEFDFDEMLVQVFVPHGFQKGSSNYSLIRRRISMVISKVVSEECSDESRIEIYKLLDHFLDPTDPLNKKFVRMYACQALRITIDVPNTKIPDFLPYLQRILEHMFVLLTKDLTLNESKKCVLQIISVIVDRVGCSIAPYTNIIMQALPPLWDESEDNYQVKCGILQILKSLIQSTGETSLKYYSLMVPMLKVSVDPGSKLVSYLVEDAITLWIVLMENAPTFSEDLLQLIPALIEIIKDDLCIYTDTFIILKSYVIYDSEYVFQHYGQAIFELFVQYLLKMGDNRVLHMCKILDVLFQKNGTEFMAHGKQLLIDSGLFATFLDMLLNENGTSLTNCIEILGCFSRLAYANAGKFVQYVAIAGIPTDYKEQHPDLLAVAEDDAVGVVLDFWLGNFDSIKYPWQRKLNALGLTSLIRTGNDTVMQRLQKIMVIWSQVLDEIHKSGTGGAEGSYTKDETGYRWGFCCVNIEDEAREMCFEQTFAPQENARKSALFQKDLVHTICLRDYINAALEEARALSADHAKIVSTAFDPALIDMLSGVLK